MSTNTKTNVETNSTGRKQFLVRKEFIGGLLGGIAIEERTGVRFKVGFVCRKPAGGSPYRVTSCVEVANG
jgi:hypothetical protein